MATRGLPLLLEIGLLIFCLIECIQTPQDEVRNLPKVGWIALIVIIPFAGAIAWLTTGRPQRGKWTPPRTTVPRGPVGPDDDPEFLAKMNQVDAEHEEMLKRWEDDLRRREERLRHEDDENGS